MMRRTFYLVRHALKEKSIGDVSITPEGVLQAQATARYFSQLPISAVIASPLRRASETAQHIASKTSAPLTQEERLRERANWGDLPGQTFEQFVEMWDRCTREPEYVPPVGDSAKQAGERMHSVLLELAEQHPPDSHIVVVTHGGVLTDFLINTFTDNELNAWHPDFAAVQSSLISECSITRLIYETGRFKIDSFAVTDHLKG